MKTLQEHVRAQAYRSENARADARIVAAFNRDWTTFVPAAIVCAAVEAARENQREVFESALWCPCLHRACAEGAAECTPCFFRRGGLRL